jgi:acetoin reductase-like protein
MERASLREADPGGRPHHEPIFPETFVRTAGTGRRSNEGDPQRHKEAIMKITDKVAIITGAARGIGKAIAERYIKEGAKVVIADLNEEGAKAVASALGPNAFGVKLDITQQESIDATVAATVAHFGRLDILVNNAGIFDLAPIIEITRESYRRVYAVNVEGLLFMLQAGAKQMIKQGHGGKIINFASQAGRRGEALVAIYCSSKAAVISLTQSAGLDLIKYRVNVNAIAPGVVDNEHWDHVDSLFAKYEHLPPGEKKRIVGLSVPFGRMARPDEIGGLATFLASEDADYIVAQTYNIDGGNWMS